MKILILGFGKTGQEVYKFLQRYSYEICIYDENEISTLGHNYYSYERLKNELPQFDLCIRSPGITKTSKIYFLADALSKRIISELEFSLNFLHTKHIVGVTGTNGKTSTCLMIRDLLSEKYQTHLLGNYQMPLISMVENIKSDDILILEISSFMLEDTSSLSCEVAIITNLSENHLDHTINLESYYAYKKRLLFNKPKLIIDCEENKKENNYVSSFNSVNLINLNNAIKVAKYYSLSDEEIKRGIKNIKLDPFRQEIVLKKDGLIFINDSKSTSIHSTQACIDEYSNLPAILILGGIYKGENIEILNLDNLSRVYCYGQIANLFKNNVIKKDNLREILEEIKLLNFKGYILFSPVGSSFDLYTSYQERGEEFNKLVKELWEHI